MIPQIPKAPPAGVIFVGYFREISPTPCELITPLELMPLRARVAMKAKVLSSFSWGADRPWFVLGGSVIMFARVDGGGEL